MMKLDETRSFNSHFTINKEGDGCTVTFLT